MNSSQFTFPIYKFPKINFKERKSLFWEKMDMGRLDIYFGGGEMNWGIWEKVEGCGYGGNGLFMGEFISKVGGMDVT